MNPPGLLESLVRALSVEGVDLQAWGLAWARVAPAVTIVPAFGLRALPGPARIGMGLLLAATLAPALRPVAHGHEPWLVLALVEVLRGLPVALSAAIPLWAATMAGGVVDALRGAQDGSPFPTLEGRASPLGVLFSLVAATLFLGTGGPAQIALALITPSPDLVAPVARAAMDLAAGITLAIAVAAPLVGASIVVEVTGALLARAASPAHVHALLAPLRSLALLLLTALLLDRMAIVLRAGAPSP